MGYSIYIIGKNKAISKDDFDSAINKLKPYFKTDSLNLSICDVNYFNGTITISGSFSISGKHAEGFTLNMAVNLIALDITPYIYSNDFEYGSYDEFCSIIHINRPDLYNGKEDTRTKKRLLEIKDLGMTEVLTAEFGIKNICSGLYIERIWNYSDQEFNEYIDWVKSLINTHKETIPNSTI